MDEREKIIVYASAWEFSRQELLKGRICSLVGAKERRRILEEAKEAGVLDGVVTLIEKLSPNANLAKGLQARIKEGDKNE